MLFLERKKGESILINDNITVTVEEISRGKVKLSVEAPKEIPILRRELAEAAEINREAASSLELWKEAGEWNLEKERGRNEKI